MVDGQKTYPDWRGYAAAELDRQYTGIVPPDFQSRIIPGWMRRSGAFRDWNDGRLDIAYGARERERLDLFPAKRGDKSPAVIFFHGGYWQRFDKSVFSFVAQGLVRRGVSVLLPSYDLCPTVRLEWIVGQARQAVAWAWRHAPELRIDRRRLLVMGHSAGGHLTAMLAATDWPALAPDLPSDLVAGAVPISGLFELEPLRHTSVNKGLQLDAASAAANSPRNHPPLTRAPQLVVCGELEPAEFHRQSDDYATAFRTAERPMHRYTVPGRDHMNELDDLADERSELFAHVMALVRS